VICTNTGATQTETGSLVYNSDYVQRQVVGPPVERITDPILYQNNAYAVKKFYGTPEETERLDPSRFIKYNKWKKNAQRKLGYKIRRPGRKFFKLGKVLKIQSLHKILLMAARRSSKHFGPR